MEEALHLLRLLWTQESVSFEGRFHQFDELTVYPRPVQRPHPPLWVAGVADAAVDRAARLGDAWLCGPVQSLSKAQSCLAVYREACARVGRPDDWVLRRYTWLGPDARQVRDEVLPGYVDGLMEHWRESAEDDVEKALFKRIDQGEDVTPAEIAADRLLWGSPDQVIEQIMRYRTETGCTHVHASFGAGLSATSSAVSSLGSVEDMAAMIRLFGQEVIPAFAAAEPSRPT
jgi:alkanesulfonate monooxygenase SsuD/methylene tetrahydromethanopterin reductase-like flavin-dependent oxidoreductase (luciferase family)